MKKYGVVSAIAFTISCPLLMVGTVGAAVFGNIFAVTLGVICIASSAVAATVAWRDLDDNKKARA